MNTLARTTYTLMAGTPTDEEAEMDELSMEEQVAVDDYIRATLNAPDRLTRTIRSSSAADWAAVPPALNVE